MKKMLLLSALLVLSTASVSAKDWTDIRMASEGAYPPFNEIGANGALKGFDIDIGNALCAEMKAKCTWVKQEWDGMIPALMARKFDAIVASMSITEERKAKVDFTNKYYASPVVLIAKTGLPLRPELASLKGKKVAVQRGTVADNFATKYWDGKGVEIVRYGKQDEAYLDLKSGRVDATFADYWEAYGGFLTKPEGAGYGVLGEQLYGKNAEERAVIGEGIGIAVRKKDQDLKAQLNKALAAVRANGKYEEIRKKYFTMDIYGD
ncbi:ABC transporter substrate-binding protein [Candidatus Accumulibacter cognatus]|uniref:Lysine-arginine-ornithine-binding periplasmic protein n=1 Tax=Candidatus Accumulibacter cognatus TaxID=2954383 RepID=A0A080MAH2_9PROT|nr:ABC transporter substrate-binding protein [Candidatus Accumulibacter cognatus]KFB78243.1 MAG: Lysine-arginine-ornithine-binding periplasmic protein precursor [Candidatus Accumulibacter cognatus]